MAAEKVFEVKDGTFEKFVSRNDIHVVIDFWAPWCGPCRKVAPMIADFAERYEGSILFGKINVDEDQEVAKNYKIDLIPTVIVFKNGLKVERIVGLKTEEEFEEIFRKYMK